tara:strand:- start:134 stop:610 length:477 start_codon:yes stop_codon:yes gene_type:complete
MSYGPKVWGPHGWGFLHYITIGYPNNPKPSDKIKYKTFFENLKDVIPCKLCSNHYKAHLLKYPLDNKVLSNKKSFINWGVDVHNAVNKLNKKKIYNYKNAVDEIITKLKYMYVEKNNDIKNIKMSACPYRTPPITIYTMYFLIFLIVILLHVKITNNF